MGKKVKITINDGENKVKLIIKNGCIHIKAIEANGIPISPEDLKDNILYKDNENKIENKKKAIQSIDELNTKYNYYKDLKRKLMVELDEYSYDGVKFIEDETMLKLAIRKNTSLDILFDIQDDTCKVVSNIMIPESKEKLEHLGNFLVEQLKNKITANSQNGKLTLSLHIEKLSKTDDKLSVISIIVQFAEILFNNKEYLTSKGLQNVLPKSLEKEEISIEKYYSELVDELTVECFRKADAKDIKWLAPNNKLCGSLDINVGFNITASSQSDDVDAIVYTYLKGTTDELFSIGKSIAKNYDTKATISTKQDELNFCTHISNPFKNKMTIENVVKQIIDVIVMVKENSKKFQVKDATEFMLKEALTKDDEPNKKRRVTEPYRPSRPNRSNDSLFPSAHGFVCYYGCPNSDKVLKLQTKKNKKKDKGERRGNE